MDASAEVTVGYDLGNQQGNLPCLTFRKEGKVTAVLYGDEARVVAAYIRELAEAKPEPEPAPAEMVERVAQAIFESRYPFSWAVASQRSPDENLGDDAERCRRDARAAIAAMPEAAKPAPSLQRVRESVLLAARWFKLYQEDKTRYGHPASDADLLGMFDKMQEALAQLDGKGK